jgi:CMP-N-acetylneuraminic acid synthetase
VEALSACVAVTKVVIDTDSPTIKEMCAKDFPHVIVLDRPEHLRDGSIPMNDVLLNITNQIQTDFYLQTHSTNPVLTADTVSKAVNAFCKSFPVHDSLFSVTRKQVRMWDALARPLNHNQNILLRTQDLPPIYEENSCIYIFSKDILLQKHNRIGNRPFMFEMEEIEAQDIDVELNFKMAEFLFKETRNKK